MQAIQDTRSRGLFGMLGVKKEDSFLLLAMYLAFVTNGMTYNLLGAILPDIRSAYKLSYVFCGTLITMHQIGCVVISLVAGILMPLLGRKSTVCSLECGFIIGLVGMTLFSSPSLLILSFMITGFGRGTTSNITNMVVSEVASNKGAALNVLHSTSAIGAMLSPFVAIVFTRLFGNVGWRYTAYFVALVALCSIVTIAASSLKNTPARRCSAPTKSKTSEAAEVPFYKSMNYWLVTLILFSYMCGESSLTGWLVTYFKDTGILPGVVAKSSTSLMWLMMLIGRLTTAVLSSRLDKNKFVLCLVLSQIAFFILMLVSHNTLLIILSLLLLGLSLSGTYPTTISTLKAAYASDSMAIGFVMCISNAGSIIMPVIVGAIAEHLGIYLGIASIALALITTLTLVIVKLAAERGAKALSM